MKKKTLHLVVRFSDTMFDVGDVITCHNNVVISQGAVWFGKLGQTLSQQRIDLLNKQLEIQTPTFLYLVKGNRKKSTAYRAPLILVSREAPSEIALIPPYYAEKDILQYMKTWMKIGQIQLIDLSAMHSLKAISSVVPIIETLALSSSGYFLVYESK